MGGSQSCTPFTCDSTSQCKVACLVDDDCAPPNTCNKGSCGPKPIGASCSVDGDCNSLICAQGVCCSTGCSGTCKSCALVASAGICTMFRSGKIRWGSAGPMPPLSAPPPARVTARALARPVLGSRPVRFVPRHHSVPRDSRQQGVCCASSCTETCQSCAFPGQPAAARRCRPAKTRSGNAPTAGRRHANSTDSATEREAVRITPLATICLAASCSTTTLHPSSTCNGTGTCIAPATASCTPYVCGPSTCKTACATASDWIPCEHVLRRKMRPRRQCQRQHAHVERYRAEWILL